jgi:hypothetical protein
MKHIAPVALIAAALLGAASPVAAQDPQWARDLQKQMEASAAAVAEAMAQLGRVQRARPRAPRDAARGPELTEPFTRTVRLGEKGTLDVTTIAGQVTIDTGGGDNVKIAAVKRVRGTSEAEARALLQQLQVLVNERPGLLEVRAQFPRPRSFPFMTVDYTITVPPGTSLTLRTTSGDVSVDGVRGDISANTVSGTVALRDSRSPAIDVETISGDLHLQSVQSDRVQLKTVSGNIEYGGALARSGRYDMSSHSGDIRIVAPKTQGFDIEASTFSGNVSSEYPITLRGGSGNGNGFVRVGGPGHSVRGSFGDAGAVLTLRSFSGNIAIVKK